MLSDRDYMRPNDPWQPWPRPQASVIKPLIIANVIVFLISWLSSGQGDGMGVLDVLTLHPYYLRRGQVWRLGTYLFAHASLSHIFFNMWGLYLFGKLVEARLGAPRFLRLYFFSGLIGGLTWLLANWWVPVLVGLDPRASIDSLVSLQEMGAQVMRDRGDVIARGSVEVLVASGLRVVRVYGGVVGASGAVFGVMMAAAMTAPNLRIMLLIPPVPMRLKTFVAVYGLIEVALAWRAAVGSAGTRIAHLAHLGGLLGAFLYMHRLGHPTPWGILRDLSNRWRARRQRQRLQAVDSPPAGGVPSAEIDRILDKIGREGMQSLTEEERQVLLEVGRRLRDHPGR